MVCLRDVLRMRLPTRQRVGQVSNLSTLDRRTRSTEPAHLGQAGSLPHAPARGTSFQLVHSCPPKRAPLNQHTWDKLEAYPTRQRVGQVSNSSTLARRTRSAEPAHLGQAGNLSQRQRVGQVSNLSTLARRTRSAEPAHLGQDGSLSHSLARGTSFQLVHSCPPYQVTS